jgi:signal transduction histidine kinase
MWVLGAAETPADVLDDLRGMCPDLRLHRGDDPPTETCDVLMLWAEADVPEVDAGALEARRSGLARVVAIVAPGAHGMVEGRSEDEPSHIVKIDPAWGPLGIATVLQGALAGARESARAEEIAETQESFVAIASHDLRTPVSTLRLLHDLFRSKLNARAEKLTPGELSDIEELLDIMERNLEKMDGFIGDILEAWRLYRGRPQLAAEPVSLNSVAEDIVAGLFPSAMKKDIALDLVMGQSLGPIMAEPRRVGQVVANLVENAVKYTPPGGSVTVRTLPNGEAGGAVLEVADTGPGVPEEERDRLFQRFGRGSARTTGGEPSTGLGLFICREIVEQHGGRVWFEPVEGPGHGSRFFASWPLAQASSEDRGNS